MSDLHPELAPHILKALQGFIALTNNPNQTDAVFALADGLRYTDIYSHFIEYAHAQPAVAQILKERYLPPLPNLDSLLHYPENSLGYAYASTMKATGLDPDFYPKLNVIDDYSYIAIRMRQTHDIWHLITDFNTDLAGELGLQAFTLAQTHSPLAVTILAAVIMYVLKSSGPLNQMVDSIQRGWQIGLDAQPFLAQKWEDNWEMPVSEWRGKLGVNAAV